MSGDLDKIRLLRHIYEKYDNDGIGLTLPQTVRMLVRLSKHIHVLKKIEYQETVAAFSFLDKDGDGRINFQELQEWWNSEDRYAYFVGEKAKIIRKAYSLYSKYATSTKMAPHEFFRFLDDNDISYTEYSFQTLTSHAQLTFSEFMKWLEWL